LGCAIMLTYITL